MLEALERRASRGGWRRGLWGVAMKRRAGTALYFFFPVECARMVIKCRQNQVHYALPPTGNNCLPFSTSMPAFVIMCALNLSHSDWGNMKYQSSFNL